VRGEEREKGGNRGEERRHHNKHQHCGHRRFPKHHSVRECARVAGLGEMVRGAHLEGRSGGEGDFFGGGHLGAGAHRAPRVVVAVVEVCPVFVLRLTLGFFANQCTDRGQAPEGGQEGRGEGGRENRGHEGQGSQAGSRWSPSRPRSCRAPTSCCRTRRRAGSGRRRWRRCARWHTSGPGPRAGRGRWPGTRSRSRPRSCWAPPCCCRTRGRGRGTGRRRH